MSSLEGKDKRVNGLMSVGWRAFDCCVWQAWSDVNHPSPPPGLGPGQAIALSRAGERGLMRQAPARDYVFLIIGALGNG